MANLNLNSFNIKALIEVRKKYLEDKKRKEQEEQEIIDRDIEILMERHPCNNDYDYMRYCWVVDQYFKIFNLMSYKLCLIEALSNFKGCNDVDNIFSISHNFNTETELKEQSITITNTETNDFIVLYVNYKCSNHIKATALKRFNKDLYSDLLFAKCRYITDRKKEAADLYENWGACSPVIKDLRGGNELLHKLKFHYTHTNLIIEGNKKRIINLWDIKYKCCSWVRGNLNETFRRKIFILIIKLDIKLQELINRRMDYLNKAINSKECGVCLEKKVLMPETRCCKQPLCFECRERIMETRCPYCRGNINIRNE